MIYEVEFDKSVLKFLKTCDHRIVENFFTKVDIMRYNPFDPLIDVKKLKKPLIGYRLRVGKHRFLFDIIAEKILIYFYKADARGDVYKS